jgi:hypothetical protein
MSADIEGADIKGDRLGVRCSIRAVRAARVNPVYNPTAHDATAMLS